MFNQISFGARTAPMECGMRTSFATITAPTQALATAGADYYTQVSRPGMSTIERMNRACHIFTVLKGKCEHSYSA